MGRGREGWGGGGRDGEGEGGMGRGREGWGGGGRDGEGEGGMGRGREGWGGGGRDGEGEGGMGGGWYGEGEGYVRVGQWRKVTLATWCLMYHLELRLFLTLIAAVEAHGGCGQVEVDTRYHAGAAPRLGGDITRRHPARPAAPFETNGTFVREEGEGGGKIKLAFICQLHSYYFSYWIGLGYLPHHSS